MKKYLKYILPILLITILCCDVQASNKINVVIFGENFEFKTNKPIMRNKRVLIPLKSGLFSKIDASVQYDVINKESTIKTESYYISNYLNEFVWYNNGLNVFTADVRSDFINGQSYIPLHAAFETLGYKVKWDDDTYTVYIENQ